ncbi:SchA/CurD-like domain-containing protein [Streptomyces hydrogenans]|uniref:SchA/CurD-like domain-containing protein n=1 Tax=Streptomyces hydrogenans TaxID=1873719 RepID=UPI0035DB7D7C
MSFVAVGARLAPDAVRRFAAAPPPPSPLLDADGPVLSAAVFVREELLILAFHLREEYDDPAAVLAGLPEVARWAEHVAPFLETPWDPSAGFAEALRERLMRRVQQRVVNAVPAALSAIHYPVRPGAADELTTIFTAVRPQATPMLRDEQGDTSGSLHGVAVFVTGPHMVRVVAYDGEVADVARYMAHRPGRPQIEARLTPYLEDYGDTSTPEGFVAVFERRSMERRALSVPVGAGSAPAPAAAVRP